MSHPDLVESCLLSSVELLALRSRGIVYLVGYDAYLPTDITERPSHRVGALTDGLPSGLAIARETAAWVYCGGVPPSRPHVVTSTDDVWRAEFVQRAPRPLLRVHHGSTDPDALDVNGSRVTSPLRTGIDLAIWSPPEVSIPLLIKLIKCTTFNPVVARARILALQGQRFQARARRSLTIAAEHSMVGGVQDTLAMPQESPAASSLSSGTRRTPR